MSALDEALDALTDSGTVTVDRPNGEATVEVDEVGPVGVRVRKVRVEHGPTDIPTHVEQLGDLRALPERLMPVEVAPSLGGASLRSKPDEMQEDRFFEVEVRDGATQVTRKRITEDGRTDESWPMTRDGLGRLLDELTPTGEETR